MTKNDAQPTPGGDRAAGRPRGAGPDGTIPVSDEGISLTSTGTGSNFNPEEDAPDAAGKTGPDEKEQ